jgi:C_GCAxxG_C_C family probable redox protein
MNKKELALAQFDKGFNCSQAVFSAFAEDFDLDQETALKIAGPFGGGMGRMAETCGTVTGALMALGLKYSATSGEDKETKERTYALAREFVERFKARNGAATCRALLEYDISTPEGHQAAQDQKLFKSVCPKYVADAAEIAEEMINNS